MSGDDRRAWLRERADIARKSIAKEIQEFESEHKAWIERVNDIEALCLTGEIASPARTFFLKRCPECKGRLKKEVRRDVVARTCGSCEDAGVYTLLSCVRCEYEWAASAMFTSALGSINT